MDKVQACIADYMETRNLKVTGDRLGIPWQTVYVYLKKAGVAVTGDKLRYGSDKDRLAARAEMEFLRLIPFAKNQNNIEFQSKIDFMVGQYSVDVKSSTLHRSSKHFESKRWAFSVKKQEFSADFIVCFGFYEDMSDYQILMMPGELIRKYQTLAVNPYGKGKWMQYRISPDALKQFFCMLLDNEAA